MSYFTPSLPQIFHSLCRCAWALPKPFFFFCHIRSTTFLLDFFSSWVEKEQIIPLSSLFTFILRKIFKKCKKKAIGSKESKIDQLLPANLNPSASLWRRSGSNPKRRRASPYLFIPHSKPTPLAPFLQRPTNMNSIYTVFSFPPFFPQKNDISLSPIFPSQRKKSPENTSLSLPAEISFYPRGRGGFFLIPTHHTSKTKS